LLAHSAHACNKDAIVVQHAKKSTVSPNANNRAISAFQVENFIIKRKKVRPILIILEMMQRFNNKQITYSFDGFEKNNNIPSDIYKPKPSIDLKCTSNTPTNNTNKFSTLMQQNLIAIDIGKLTDTHTT
jgi:hypothetical protein